MEQLKKYSLLFFSAALLFPSIVNLTHMFAHNDEEVCFNFKDAHFHKKSLDCELCDLRTQNVLAFESIDYQHFIPYIPTIKSTDFYQFLSDYQKLPFALRGPPAQINA